MWSHLPDVSGSLSIECSEICRCNSLTIRLLPQFVPSDMQAAFLRIGCQSSCILRRVVKHRNREHCRQSSGDATTRDQVNSRLLHLGVNIACPVPRVGRGGIGHGLPVIGCMAYRIIKKPLFVRMAGTDFPDGITEMITGVGGSRRSATRSFRHPDPKVAGIEGLIAQAKELIPTRS